MLAKCVLTILELNWNQRFRDKTKVNICHHMLTSSTQLQNRTFNVVERTKTSEKCPKMKNARAKRAKTSVFPCQIRKFKTFLSPYHLNGIFCNSGKNSNGTVHPGGMFSEKGNTFRGIPFFSL